jgi:hypothetical protein
MGGRRAKSVFEVVGSVRGLRRGEFDKALAAKDPTEVAASSAQLVAQGPKTDDIVYYASKLASLVEEIVSSGRDLPYAERERLARQEWSRIKREEGLPDDPIITQALVSAVARALRKAKGPDAQK